MKIVKPSVASCLFLLFCLSGQSQAQNASTPSPAALPIARSDGASFTATVENAGYAGVYESPWAVTVRLKVSNSQPQARRVTATWQLRRLSDGQELAHGNTALQVRSNSSAQRRLPFPRRAGYGLYEYKVVTSAGDEIVESEARVAIMRPPPKGREMDGLGFNIHVSVDDYARLLRRLGLRWARVDWQWSLFAPTRDKVEWGSMDEQMKVAEKYGLKLFPVFASGPAPAWARLPEETFDTQAHADYVRKVLERYQGTIPAFNVVNEPDASAIKNPNLWLADVKAIHAAARAVDPNCKIVGIAMSGYTGDPGHWHWPLLNPPLALGRYLDAYDWHNYPAPRNRRPEETSTLSDGAVCSSVDRLQESLPKVRAVVAGKEVWITEHGFSVCSPLSPDVVAMTKNWPQGGPFDVTEKQQADYLVRQVILELAYGIDKVFLYQLGVDGPVESWEGQLGVVRRRPNGLSAKLAYVQIANLVQELAGATPVRVEQPAPNIRVVRFHRGPQDVVAAWTVRGVAQFDFRVTKGYQSDPFGNRTTQHGAITAELTESPIFLVGSKVE